MAVAIQFPVGRKIVAHVGVAHEAFGRHHVNVFADGRDRHMLSLGDERDVAYVRLLEDEEVNHVVQLLALKLLGDASLYDARLPGRRRHVSVEQAIR